MNRLQISNATFFSTLSLVTFSFIFFDACCPIIDQFPPAAFALFFILVLQSLGGKEVKAAGQAQLSLALNCSSTISFLLAGLRGAEVRRGSFPLGYELFGQIFVV